MVRPQIEYASVIWDPYYNSDRDKLELIQRRAARWVLSDYNRTSSVSLMLHHLSWTSLQFQRKIQDYNFFIRSFIIKYPYQFQLTIYLQQETHVIIIHIILYFHLYQPHSIYNHFFQEQLRNGTTYLHLIDNFYS